MIYDLIFCFFNKKKTDYLHRKNRFVVIKYSKQNKKKKIKIKK